MIAEQVQSVIARIAELSLQSGLSEPATLVAVSKTKPPAMVREAHAAGAHIFGENRVQEGEGKIAGCTDLPGIAWHLIGHLQTNKTAKAVALFDMIQSVDRERLVDSLVQELSALESTRAANESAKKFPVLVQINTSREETKSGVEPDETERLVDYLLEKGGEYLALNGIMTIGPLTDDRAAIATAFREAKRVFDRIRNRYGRELPVFSVLSMGMSHDFELAIREGSTMVRIGSLLFGERV